VTGRLLRATAAFLGERRQFGVPLGTFQALQHRLADMHLAREQAVALVGAVAGRMQGPAAERSLAVSSAKVVTNRACQVVGQGAVQLHGAMGVTEELAAGRFFRRATELELLYGSTGLHLRRVERLMANGAPARAGTPNPREGAKAHGREIRALVE
jgi:alkylation response protein AidB-like acyl-CoA dehydrogenase